MPGRPAVFLDRDGTINALTPGEYIIHPEELRLLPGAARAIRSLNRLGYLVIVVTNQGVIARGKATERQIETFHDTLRARLAKHGARVDAIYYCPHHPDGAVPRYAKRCHCRKPGPGMLRKAMRDFDIDVRRSFLVGDTTSDVLAGRRAGVHTVLVKTGYGGTDNKHDEPPDATVANLERAVAYIRAHGRR